jgi:hypothetical protein
MMDMTGTMMEELANIITCVTGDARQRRTIYEADQDFERFGKTLIANFKDTATLRAFLRASLRQCHIHKLSKVGKDKAAWAKADEYLTNLMDSDTMLTLENTNDAIKRAEKYMQRQDTDGDKRVAFSSAVDDSTDGHDEVSTLRAKVLALEAKLDSFSHGQTDGGNKRKKTAKKNQKECVRIPGSRPGIMWTCIVRVTGIMSTMIPGEGIQHACGQFEHAIDSVNLARVKRKEKKRGETWFPFNFV